MTERQERFSSRPGLFPKDEDIHWLAIARAHGWAAVPQFNRSRLIAMKLVDAKNDPVVLTRKGEELLNLRDAMASRGADERSAAALRAAPPTESRPG